MMNVGVYIYIYIYIFSLLMSRQCLIHVYAIKYIKRIISQTYSNMIFQEPVAILTKGVSEVLGLTSIYKYS